MIEITKEKWEKIHKDYKTNLNGIKKVFAGCIKKNGGTVLLIENKDFKII